MAIYNKVLTPEQIQTHYFAAQQTAPLPPRLSVSLASGQLVLSWPSSAEGFNLQMTDRLGTPTVWTSAGVAASQEGDQFVARIPVAGGTRFFRLQR